MKLFFGLLLISTVAWAQPDRSNDEPSPAVREQQRQAEQARKQHPKSTPPQRSHASLRKPGDKNAKPTPSRPGEAAVSTGR